MVDWKINFFFLSKSIREQMKREIDNSHLSETDQSFFFIIFLRSLRKLKCYTIICHFTHSFSNISLFQNLYKCYEKRVKSWIQSVFLVLNKNFGFR